MSEKIGQNGDEGMKSAGGEDGEEAFVESSCSGAPECEDATESQGEIRKNDGEEPHIADISKESRQKRSKRLSAKGLATLLENKSKMLHEMSKDLEKAEQSIKIKEDKLLRMAAEFENYKKRTRREWDLLQKKATADLLNDLLSVLDDFERAFEAAGETGDHFFSGIRMIHSRFVEILERAGLSEIEAKGRPFDPQFHEAMGEAESEGTEDGCVVNVVQKGYMVRDQLLRPARVIIAKKREQ